jgi:drug/metabolite transporter (DMT)-like permease
MDATGAAVALLLSLLWGANPVAIKLGLLDTPPLRLAVMRFVVGGAVVVLWGWLTGRLAGMRVAADEWRPLVTIGVLLGAQVSLLNIGTSLTSAAHAAVLLNMYAVHTRSCSPTS